MKNTRCLASGLVLLVALLTGCMSVPMAPTFGLQRSLYPGLAHLRGDQINQAFDTTVTLQSPVSGGLAWLSEGPHVVAGSVPPVSEYHRTGVIEAALAALRKAPFASVASLPTIPEVTDRPPSSNSLEALRSASARFQYDVALVLQTGVAEDRGPNPLALGYLGLVTIPLFPGTDLGVSSSAELCAVDVRTGIMLGCSRGRASAQDRFLFPLSVNTRRDELVEETLRSSVTAAATDLLQQVSVRVAK